MIEETIIKYLNDNLSVKVYMERPEDVPFSYVIMEKIGSSVSNYIHRDTFAFQSYGETLFKACKLNEEVKKALNNMINLDEIASVRLTNDYNFTDTETKQYRYQCIYDIVNYK